MFKLSLGLGREYERGEEGLKEKVRDWEVGGKGLKIIKVEEREIEG